MKLLFIDTLYPTLLEEKGHFQKSSNIESYDSLHDDLTSQGFSSGFYFSRECSKLGIEASVIYANSQRQQDAWAKQNNQIRSKSSSLRWKYWQLLSRIPLVGHHIQNRSELIRILFKQIEQIKPDYIYNLNINFLNGKLVRELKAHGYKVIGQIASPLPPKTFYQDYDHIFSAHPGQVKQFIGEGISSTWMPLSIDDEIQREFEREGWPQRFRDVTFIGTFGRHQKNTAPLLKEISRKVPSLDIYTLSSPKKLRRLGLEGHYRGKAWGKAMLKIFAESKIVINRHGEVAEGFAVNFRLFEATGMGALVLTESSPNLHDLFVEGEEIISYISNEDASKKIENILANYDSFAHIANGGQTKTIKHHTYTSRAKEIIEQLETLNRSHQ